MSATMTLPELPASTQAALDRRDFALRLKQQTCACRLMIGKLGTRKALTREQVKLAAETFDASDRVMSASKRLIDTKDPSYRAVRKVITRAKHHWLSMTTPYPEAGVRLMRRSAVDLFNTFMAGCRTELREAAKALEAKRTELIERARIDLGDLFNEADYPDRLDDAFELHWDFPSVDPPGYLKELNPELYAQECEKISARFQESVVLAEQAFAAQLQQLVTHLVERLKGDVDGKPKVFRDSAVENLNAFFEQFRTLNIGSSGQLEELVQTAQKALTGVTPDELRGNADARASVVAALAGVEEQMSQMMIDRPERAISLEDE